MTESEGKTLYEKLGNSRYQPTRAEKECEHDMPGTEMKDLLGAFFNPPQAGRPK